MLAMQVVTQIAGFYKKYKVQILSGTTVVMNSNFYVYRGGGSKLDNPSIETILSGQQVRRKMISESKGQEMVQLNFNKIPISKVQSITEIRVTPIE